MCTSIRDHLCEVCSIRAVGLYTMNPGSGTLYNLLCTLAQTGCCSRKYSTNFWSSTANTELLVSWEGILHPFLCKMPCILTASLWWPHSYMLLLVVVRRSQCIYLYIFVYKKYAWYKFVMLFDVCKWKLPSASQKCDLFFSIPWYSEGFMTQQGDDFKSKLISQHSQQWHVISTMIKVYCESEYWKRTHEVHW